MGQYIVEVVQKGHNIAMQFLEIVRRGKAYTFSIMEVREEKSIMCQRDESATIWQEWKQVFSVADDDLIYVLGSAQETFWQPFIESLGQAMYSLDNKEIVQVKRYFQKAEKDLLFSVDAVDSIDAAANPKFSCVHMQNGERLWASISRQQGGTDVAVGEAVPSSPVFHEPYTKAKPAKIAKPAKSVKMAPKAKEKALAGKHEEGKTESNLEKCDGSDVRAYFEERTKNHCTMENHDR